MATVRAEEVPHYRRADGGDLVADAVGLESVTERRHLWADVVRVAAYTGLRLGDLRALHWRDVDFTDATRQPGVVGRS